MIWHIYTTYLYTFLAKCLMIQYLGILKRALEFNWQVLLEDIGLWIPLSVYHIERDDKPENAPEGSFPYTLHAAWIMLIYVPSAFNCCQTAAAFVNNFRNSFQRHYNNVFLLL
jgi:hypothetical protein